MLLRHAAAFGHLRRLDLSENLLDVRGPEIVKVLPNTIVDAQRSYAALDERYVAVGE
jgi:hypothetical protein